MFYSARNSVEIFCKKALNHCGVNADYLATTEMLKMQPKTRQTQQVQQGNFADNAATVAERKRACSDLSLYYDNANLFVFQGTWGGVHTDSD